jgi:uncharacterized membrane protein YedE/YeeE
LIGVLAIACFSVAGSPFGVSKAFSQTSAMILEFLVPEYVKNNEYVKDTMPSVIKGSGIDWIWMLVAGIFLGAFISSRASGEFKIEIVPELWKKRFGPSKIKRLGVAFLGGAMLLFGARLAGGCTSGHGINGSLQLALSGWIFFVVIFIFGIFTARIMYGDMK